MVSGSGALLGIPHVDHQAAHHPAPVSSANTNASNAVSEGISEGQGSAIQGPPSRGEEESALSAAEADAGGPSRMVAGRNGNVPRQTTSMVSTAVQPAAGPRREQQAQSPKVHRTNSVVSQTQGAAAHAMALRGGTPASVYGQRQGSQVSGGGVDNELMNHMHGGANSTANQMLQQAAGTSAVHQQLLHQSLHAGLSAALAAAGAQPFAPAFGLGGSHPAAASQLQGGPFALLSLPNLQLQPMQISQAALAAAAAVHAAANSHAGGHAHSLGGLASSHGQAPSLVNNAAQQAGAGPMNAPPVSAALQGNPHAAGLHPVGGNYHSLASAAAAAAAAAALGSAPVQLALPSAAALPAGVASASLHLGLGGPAGLGGGVVHNSSGSSGGGGQPRGPGAGGQLLQSPAAGPAATMPAPAMQLAALLQQQQQQAQGAAANGLGMLPASSMISQVASGAAGMRIRPWLTAAGGGSAAAAAAVAAAAAAGSPVQPAHSHAAPAGLPAGAAAEMSHVQGQGMLLATATSHGNASELAGNAGAASAEQQHGLSLGLALAHPGLLQVPLQGGLGLPPGSVQHQQAAQHMADAAGPGHVSMQGRTHVNGVTGSNLAPPSQTHGQRQASLGQGPSGGAEAAGAEAGAGPAAPMPLHQLQGQAMQAGWGPHVLAMASSHPVAGGGASHAQAAGAGTPAQGPQGSDAQGQGMLLMGGSEGGDTGHMEASPRPGSQRGGVSGSHHHHSHRHHGREGEREISLHASVGHLEGGSENEAQQAEAGLGAGAAAAGASVGVGMSPVAMRSSGNGAEQPQDYVAEAGGDNDAIGENDEGMMMMGVAQDGEEGVAGTMEVVEQAEPHAAHAAGGMHLATSAIQGSAPNMLGMQQLLHQQHATSLGPHLHQQHGGGGPGKLAAQRHLPQQQERNNSTLAEADAGAGSMSEHSAGEDADDEATGSQMENHHAASQAAPPSVLVSANMGGNEGAVGSGHAHHPHAHGLGGGEASQGAAGLLHHLPGGGSTGGGLAVGALEMEGAGGAGSEPQPQASHHQGAGAAGGAHAAHHYAAPAPAPSGNQLPEGGLAAVAAEGDSVLHGGASPPAHFRHHHHSHHHAAAQPAYAPASGSMINVNPYQAKPHAAASLLVQAASRALSGTHPQHATHNPAEEEDEGEGDGNQEAAMDVGPDACPEGASVGVVDPAAWVGNSNAHLAAAAGAAAAAAAAGASEGGGGIPGTAVSALESLASQALLRAAAAADGRAVGRSEAGRAGSFQPNSPAEAMEVGGDDEAGASQGGPAGARVGLGSSHSHSSASGSGGATRVGGGNAGSARRSRGGTSHARGSGGPGGAGGNGSNRVTGGAGEAGDAGAGGGAGGASVVGGPGLGMTTARSASAEADEDMLEGRGGTAGPESSIAEGQADLGLDGPAVAVIVGDGPMTEGEAYASDAEAGGVRTATGAEAGSEPGADGLALADALSLGASAGAAGSALPGISGALARISGAGTAGPTHHTPAQGSVGAGASGGGNLADGQQGAASNAAPGPGARELSAAGRAEDAAEEPGGARMDVDAAHAEVHGVDAMALAAGGHAGRPGAHADDEQAMDVGTDGADGVADAEMAEAVVSGAALLGVAGDDADADLGHPAASVHATVIAEEMVSEFETDLSSMHARHAPGGDRGGREGSSARPHPGAQHPHPQGGDAAHAAGFPMHGGAGIHHALMGGHGAHSPVAHGEAAPAGQAMQGPPDAQGVGWLGATAEGAGPGPSGSAGSRGRSGRSGLGREGSRQPSHLRSHRAAGGAKAGSQSRGPSGPRAGGAPRASHLGSPEQHAEAGGAPDSSMAMATAGPSTRSGTISGGGPTQSNTVGMSTLADSQMANASQSTSDDDASSGDGQAGANAVSREGAGYRRSVDLLRHAARSLVTSDAGHQHAQAAAAGPGAAAAALSQAHEAAAVMHAQGALQPQLANMADIGSPPAQEVASSITGRARQSLAGEGGRGAGGAGGAGQLQGHGNLAQAGNVTPAELQQLQAAGCLSVSGTGFCHSSAPAGAIAYHGENSNVPGVGQGAQGQQGSMPEGGSRRLRRPGRHPTMPLPSPASGPGRRPARASMAAALAAASGAAAGGATNTAGVAASALRSPLSGALAGAADGVVGGARAAQAQGDGEAGQVSAAAPGGAALAGGALSVNPAGQREASGLGQAVQGGLGMADPAVIAGGVDGETQAPSGWPQAASHNAPLPHPYAGGLHSHHPQPALSATGGGPGHGPRAWAAAGEEAAAGQHNAGAQQHGQTGAQAGGQAAGSIGLNMGVGHPWSSQAGAGEAGRQGTSQGAGPGAVHHHAGEVAAHEVHALLQLQQQSPQQAQQQPHAHNPLNSVLTTASAHHAAVGPGAGGAGVAGPSGAGPGGGAVPGQAGLLAAAAGAGPVQEQPHGSIAEGVPQVTEVAGLFGLSPHLHHAHHHLHPHHQGHMMGAQQDMALGSPPQLQAYDEGMQSSLSGGPSSAILPQVTEIHGVTANLAATAAAAQLAAAAAAAAAAAGGFLAGVAENGGGATQAAVSGPHAAGLAHAHGALHGAGEDQEMGPGGIAVPMAATSAAAAAGNAGLVAMQAGSAAVSGNNGGGAGSGGAGGVMHLAAAHSIASNALAAAAVQPAGGSIVLPGTAAPGQTGGAEGLQQAQPQMGQQSEGGLLQQQLLHPGASCTGAGSGGGLLAAPGAAASQQQQQLLLPHGGARSVLSAEAGACTGGQAGAAGSGSAPAPPPPPSSGDLEVDGCMAGVQQPVADEDRPAPADAEMVLGADENARPGADGMGTTDGTDMEADADGGLGIQGSAPLLLDGVAEGGALLQGAARAMRAQHSTAGGAASTANGHVEGGGGHGGDLAAVASGRGAGGVHGRGGRGGTHRSGQGGNQSWYPHSRGATGGHHYAGGGNVYHQGGAGGGGAGGSNAVGAGGAGAANHGHMNGIGNYGSSGFHGAFHGHGLLGGVGLVKNSLAGPSSPAPGAGSTALGGHVGAAGLMGAGSTPLPGAGGSRVDGGGGLSASGSRAGEDVRGGGLNTTSTSSSFEDDEDTAESPSTSTSAGDADDERDGPSMTRPARTRRRSGGQQQQDAQGGAGAGLLAQAAQAQALQQQQGLGALSLGGGGTAGSAAGSPALGSGAPSGLGLGLGPGLAEGALGPGALQGLPLGVPQGQAWAPALLQPPQLQAGQGGLAQQPGLHAHAAIAMDVSSALQEGMEGGSSQGPASVLRRLRKRKRAGSLHTLNPGPESGSV